MINNGKTNEHSYIDCLYDILNFGELTKNRTKHKTLTLQHQIITIKKPHENFPVIKGKRVYPYKSLTEVLWFLLGKNDLRFLNEHGVNYWNAWENEQGTVGKTYGYQFRNGIDQLSRTINLLINEPTSRRNIINLWNYNDLDDMELEPCTYDYHFECMPNKSIPKKSFLVHLHVTQRSGDMFLGVPYDMMNASWILILICDFVNRYVGYEKLIPYRIYNTIHNAHIYNNHKSSVKKYLHNVFENQDNIINGITQIDFGKHLEKRYNNIDNYLWHNIDNYLWHIVDSWNSETKKYDAIHLNRNYKYIYPEIKADLVV